MGTAKAEETPDDRSRMTSITAALPTKAAKIRALGAAGYSRAAIAAFLDIRYQHVRNVLVEVRRQDPPPALPPDEEAESTDGSRFGRAYVDDEGRVALPAYIQTMMNMRPGHPVPWRFAEGEVVFMSPEAGIRRAQALAAKLPPGDGTSATAMLAAERRKDAERDERDQ